MNPISRWLFKMLIGFVYGTFTYVMSYGTLSLVCLCDCACVLVCAVITILTGQMLTLSISLLCDWFTADKH